MNKRDIDDDDSKNDVHNDNDNMIKSKYKFSG